MTGLIEVRLRESGQLFESMDPTPFPGRDLDRDAARFIVGWAREFPAGTPLTLRVHLEAHNANEAEVISQAVRNYFGAAAAASRQELRRLLAIGWRSLLIGLAFLALCLSGAEWLGGFASLAGPLVLLRESLVIGGWVALWRPLEIFLYDWWPLRADRRLFQRLSAAEIEIK